MVANPNAAATLIRFSTIENGAIVELEQRGGAGTPTMMTPMASGARPV